MHQSLFWVAVAVMQLDDIGLYSAGLSLMEMNLTTLDAFGLFSNKVANSNKSEVAFMVELGAQNTNKFASQIKKKYFWI